jgi:hypothetical protein
MDDGAITIIPEPVSCNVTGGSIMLKENATYYYDASFQKVMIYFRTRFQEMTALSITQVMKKEAATILLLHEDAGGTIPL